MSVSRTIEVVDRYTPTESRPRAGHAASVACVVFTVILGCAFWAGAVVASTPLPH